MKKVLRLLDFIFLARPVLFFPVWTVFFAGLIAAQIPDFGAFSRAEWLHVQEPLKSGRFWLSFLAITPVMAAVFIINQFTDAQSDLENNKLFLLAHGIVPKRAAVAEALLFLLVGLGAAAAVSRTGLALALLLVLVTGAAYSLPPFLWKDRPFPGLVVNITGAMLTFFFGWQTVARLGLQAFQHSLPYMFAVGAVYLLTTILDRRGDRAIGKITFAVRFGESCTVRWALAFEGLCLAWAWWHRDPVIFFPALFSLPFFLLLVFRYSESRVVPATRFPILFLSLAVAFYVPEYLLLMLGVYLLSKWYYRERFHLHYPSLTQIVEEE